MICCFSTPADLKLKSVDLIVDGLLKIWVVDFADFSVKIAVWSDGIQTVWLLSEL